MHTVREASKGSQSSYNETNI